MIPKGKNEGKGRGGEGRKNDSGKSVWGKVCGEKSLHHPTWPPATSQLTGFLSISHSVPSILLAPQDSPRRKDQRPLPTESSCSLLALVLRREEPSVPRGSTGQQQTVERKERATGRAGGWKYELCSQEVNLQPCTRQ